MSLFLKIVFSPLLFLLGVVYAGVMLLRNFAYDLGLLRSEGVGAKVISIGNITAGGTGKTPITALLAHAFEGSAILSRGYGGNYSEAYTEVNPLSKNAASIYGDEPTWFAKELPNVSVWVGSDKVLTAKALLSAHPQVHFLFADDAFQHRRLNRDVDIVVIDAGVSRLDYLPLPLGRAREDFFLGIRRADIIVLNKINLAKPSRVVRMRKLLGLLRSKKTILVEASSRIDQFQFLNSDKVLDAKDLQGKNIFLASAIARPEQFSKLVAECTRAIMKGHLALQDHSPFDQETIAKIERQAQEADAQYIVVTEKDAVKLAGLGFKFPVLVSQLKLSAPELVDAVRSRISR